MTKTNPLNFVVLLFFFFIPFVPVYAIHKTLPVPIILSILCIVFILINRIKVKKFDFLLINSFVFIFTILLSSIVSVILGNEININHFLAIVVVVALYLVVPYIVMKAFTPDKIFSVLYVSFILVVLFGLLDFIVFNFFNFSIAELVLYFPSEFPYSYGNFNGFFRNKSIFQEPGFYAWYLNVFGLLLAGYFFENNILTKFRILIVLYLVSLFTTFSTTGFLPVLLFTVFIAINSSRRAISFILILLLLSIITYFSYETITTVFERKLILDNNSKSLRLERWYDGYVLIRDNFIFGAGIGSYSLEKDAGLNSFFIKIFAESGFFSFLVFLLFFILSFFKIFFSGFSFFGKSMLFCALFANIIHWSTSTPYYFSFSWTFFPLLYFLLGMKGERIREDI